MTAASLRAGPCELPDSRRAISDSSPADFRRGDCGSSSAWKLPHITYGLRQPGTRGGSPAGGRQLLDEGKRDYSVCGYLCCAARSRQASLDGCQWSRTRNFFIDICHGFFVLEMTCSIYMYIHTYIQRRCSFDGYWRWSRKRDEEEGALG